MKTIIFRKPPSVQELRKKSGEDDMSGTAAKPFTVMQVTSRVGRLPRGVENLQASKYCRKELCGTLGTGVWWRGLLHCQKLELAHVT